MNYFMCYIRTYTHLLHVEFVSWGKSFFVGGIFGTFKLKKVSKILGIFSLKFKDIVKNSRKNLKIL